MSTQGFPRAAGVALTVLLVWATVGRADDFTFATHVNLPNAAAESGVRFDCSMATNGDLHMTYLGTGWAEANEEVTLTVVGGPTFLLDSAGPVVEIRRTDPDGRVTVYRP